VEVVGLELETHHAVIEPVSPCAGNGNFRCRDRGAKSGFCLAGDGYRDYQKRAKAPFGAEIAKTSTDPPPSPSNRSPLRSQKRKFAQR
jgi:hypothetical protein